MLPRPPPACGIPSMKGQVDHKYGGRASPGRLKAAKSHAERIVRLAGIKQTWKNKVKIDLEPSGGHGSAQFLERHSSANI